MRLLFMGMGGVLSSAPLQHLLQAGYTFSAIVIAAARPGTGWRALPRPGGAGRTLPVVTSPAFNPSIVQLAWANEIPLYEAGDWLAEETTGALRQLAPDVVLVSCFAYRLPGSLLRLPEHGFLNLHPSLLPDYRGPFPLFWQLRDGLSDIGLTIHRMDEGLDEGPVAMQTKVALDTGLSGSEIERRVGQKGGALFARTLEALAAGDLTFQAQAGRGSYQGRPQDGDFALDRRWSARRAFNFMRGTAEWGRPYPLGMGARRRLLRQALAYEPHGSQSQPVLEDHQGIRIQFNPGILRAV